MKFETIADAFEFLRDGYSYSECLADCINASRQSKAALEHLLDSTLWVPESYIFDNEADKQYYMEMGKIEELLVEHGLIYND